ncbi:MAG: hypothetical protein GY870_07840 [archaeon]|nr:hypothetical protein [archaeon]
MRIVLFGDEDSGILFNLVGVDSIIYEEKGFQEFKMIFEELLEDPDIGIIIITDRLFIRYKDYILPYKMQRRRPIIVEIPEIIGGLKEDYAQKIIKRFIGIDISEKSIKQI